jgi:phosphatidylinositol glycan class V
MASFGGIWTYYRACLQPQNRTPTDRKMTARPFLDPRIAIHVHIQLAITLILLFFSHVQIFLRQASTLPAFWWGLADGIHRHWHASYAGSKSSSSSTPSSTYWAWWFPWIVAWTPISVVLWAGFYPPA